MFYAAKIKSRLVRGQWPLAVWPRFAVVAQAFAASVAGVEGRIGQDEVGLEVLVQIAVETVGVLGAEVGLDVADGEVHVGQAPGRRVGLLAEDGERRPPWASMNSSD